MTERETGIARRLFKIAFDARQQFVQGDNLDAHSADDRHVRAHEPAAPIRRTFPHTMNLALCRCGISRSVHNMINAAGAILAILIVLSVAGFLYRFRRVVGIVSAAKLIRFSPSAISPAHSREFVWEVLLQGKVIRERLRRVGACIRILGLLRVRTDHAESRCGGFGAAFSRPQRFRDASTSRSSRCSRLRFAVSMYISRCGALFWRPCGLARCRANGYHAA